MKLLLLIVTVLLWIVRRLRRSNIQFHGRRPKPAIRPDPPPRRSNRPKPPWVRDEIIRLKALMSHDGCRRIADTFNFLFESSRTMTVGKTFVANVVRDAQLEIVRKRRELKHRIPRPMPRNVIWGLDLTYVDRRPILGIVDRRPILGIVDNGTRACLVLRELTDKRAITLLRSLLDVVELFGRPKVIRTDNEASFRSWIFRLGLKVLCIRHQRIAPFAPWQNGRIEQFFATFKRALRLWQPEESIGQPDLDVFRFWYNHVRHHQHLDGRTPAEVWNQTTPRQGRVRYVSAWDGVLAGFVR